MTYNFTLKGQSQLLTSGQDKLRSLGDPSRSKYISFDVPCRDEHNETNHIVSPSYLDLKLLAKKNLVTSSDLNDLKSGQRRQISLEVQINTLYDAIPPTLCRGGGGRSGPPIYLSRKPTDVGNKFKRQWKGLDEIFQIKFKNLISRLPVTSQVRSNTKCLTFSIYCLSSAKFRE